MRIGTWNLDGHPGAGHRALLEQHGCDVWLLTEVHPGLKLNGYQPSLTIGLMGPNRHWAAVYSRAALTPLPDPHPASAAAVINGATFCSSILPWRTCGNAAPWSGASHAKKTDAALTVLRRELPTDGTLIWGGDFNQALLGPERAGSLAGREHLFATFRHFGQQVPTAGLRHRIDGLASIDHVTVADHHQVSSVERICAASLSDHDAYVVEIIE